jgi:hypothetical protein
VHILGEEGRTVSLVEVPAITLQPEPEPHHSPLKRTHSRSKSYAGHEKVQINEVNLPAFSPRIVGWRAELSQI